jgi:uncharacterized protein with ParB-like and HNH nuclease domain
MEVYKTPLQLIISKPDQQYIVPLFQRPYSWNKKEWSELWEDMTSLLEDERDKRKTHFLGSIVTMAVEQKPHGINKYVLIDGQQRLTTLSIFLLVIRDLTKNQQLSEKIQEQQLINKFAKEEDDKYKLLPTQPDRPAFQALIQQQAISPKLEKNLIIQCYRFFAKRVKKDNEEKLARIISNQLTVVSIVLDHDENPHLIFESLNARGRPLTQADLARNYFFMRIANHEQEAIFKQYWQPMQDVLADNLTEFLRHYLMAMKASFVRKNEVYISLKNWIESSAKVTILEHLQKIKTYADYYQKILYPEYESSTKIQSALKRIQQIEVTVAFPFLLKCYHDYVQKQLSKEAFCQILHFIESLMIRHSVCNLPSYGLNKLFPTLYREAWLDNAAEFINTVAHLLQSKGNLPSDEEFKTNLITADFYGRAEGRERTKFILESLESSHQHKEAVNFEKLTIEHIMPRKLNEWWQHHLGEDWENIHELYLHTLGNLTLTGYNSELSNRSFSEKQKALAQSHVELNRYFASVTQWKREQIEKRAEHLAKLALKIWPYFGNNKPETLPETNEVTGTKPLRLVMKGEEITVKSWRNVLEQMLNWLAKEKPKIFANLSAEYPRLISKDANSLRYYSRLNNDYYVEVHLSAEHIYRFCQRVMEYCGYSKEDWRIDCQ